MSVLPLYFVQLLYDLGRFTKTQNTQPYASSKRQDKIQPMLQSDRQLSKLVETRSQHLRSQTAPQTVVVYAVNLDVKEEGRKKSPCIPHSVS